MSRPLPPVAVVVLGLMASGKTTVGRLLAAELGRPFVDGDAELQARTGRTARQLQAGEGRARLHELERAVLAQQRDRPVVLAAAASVADTDEGLELLAGCTVVVLDVAVETLRRRVRSAHRPLPEDDEALEELLRSQRAERLGRYRRVATVVVEPGGRTAADVAGEIAARLGARVTGGPPGEHR
ncbi:MAG: shikimate kinase [Acidimicrobiia bacterium]